MRIITINLNGIRSAAKKGFFAWLMAQNADVVCIQELKAQEKDLQDTLFYPAGYHAYFHCAEQKGYSGVGIYSRYPALDVTKGLGFSVADQEGRYIAIDLGKVCIASLYLPSGTSGEHRQLLKYEFLERYADILVQNKSQAKEYVICGDWNIAHRPIDLKNWRANQKNSGFLPAERSWMDTLFDRIGYVDAFRGINSNPDHYTWWSNRGQSWAKNVGWRIDYQIITPGLKSAVKSAFIYKEQRFSDHAPLIMDYDIIL